MTTGSISGYTYGTALALQRPAAMMASLTVFRRAEVRELAPFAHRYRLVIRAMLVTLMTCALPCSAVSLGDATQLSGAAQPLRVEIELVSEIQPGLQVRIASEQAFRENGLAYSAWLGNAQVSLLQAQGMRRRAALLLQAPNPAQAQLVELLLEFSWPTGSTQQIYMLLLDTQAQPREAGAAPGPVVPTVNAALPDDTAGLTASHDEVPASVEPASLGITRGMIFEPALRFPVKSREHAGAVSARRAMQPAAAPRKDRLRLAQARSDQSERIAQQRREADQQARMQELERNAQQMRELAGQVAAATPPAPPPQTPASASSSASTPVAIAPAPASKPLLPRQPARVSGHAAIWPWVLAALTLPLLIVWPLRSRRARRRAEFTDSAGAAGSVFELSPAEAERAYTDYMQQRPARADASAVEEARALFTLGRFAEAQQLLDTSIQTNPRSHGAWFLLARVLCAQGDSAGFAQCIPQLRELTRETGELWNRVLMLGQELDPGNPLYQPHTPQPLPQEHSAAPAMPSALNPKPPVPPTASNAVDDALRMATAYGARPV